MSEKPADKRRSRAIWTRGGYVSSDKPVSALKPPPKGPAPGGAKPGVDKPKT